jgi:protein phosphatase
MSQHGSTALVDFAAGTAMGRGFGRNGDAFVVVPDRHIFAVADSMGFEGTAAHALAALAEADADDGLKEIEPLARAIMRASASLFLEGKANPESRGSGASICGARITDRFVTLAHLGHCRAGRNRNVRFVWCTEDHSLVAEARRAGVAPEEIARLGQLYPTVITRALGVSETIDVSLTYHPLIAGDVYMLCTDGVTRFVDQPRITSLLADESRSLDARCDALLASTVDAGGRDNATVILLRIRP